MTMDSYGIIKYLNIFKRKFYAVCNNFFIYLNVKLQTTMTSQINPCMII